MLVKEKDTKIRENNERAEFEICLMALFLDYVPDGEQVLADERPDLYRYYQGRYGRAGAPQRAEEVHSSRLPTNKANVE